MEKSTKHLLLTAFCFYMLTLSAHAIEFLSIDCGAAKGYTDELGIDWVTDDGFVQTGTNLQLTEDSEFPFASLKYFQEGRSKNCYVLPVKNQTTYLLRGSFYPGNATSGSAIESPVDFNITVNNNLWFPYQATVDVRPDGWIESIIHTFEQTELYVCLLKGTEGYPFINALELREQNMTSYYHARRQLLIRFARYNVGTKPDDETFIRFPDDPYDRIWYPTPDTIFPAYPRVENLAQPQFSKPLVLGYNWPPSKVLEDAWVGRNLSSPAFTKPLNGQWVYVAFYLQDIRPVNSTTDLEAKPLGMLLGVNDNYLEVNITDQSGYTGWLIADVKKDLFIKLTITSLPWSERDAILNGFEIYDIQDRDLSATYPKDSAALKALQASFELQDWMGDPCYPVAWDWLTCDLKTSRINKLFLSNMNISGSIPEEIITMTELTEIHLDNNNLIGSIPQSMRLLPKLQILALDNNRLTGQIPVTFQNKSGFTFTGNPGLCIPGSQSCETPSLLPAPSAAVRCVSPDMSKTLLLVVILSLGVVHLGWN